MNITYLTKKVSVQRKKAIWAWAKRLEAEEGTVWSDGSITLLCEDGIICERYYPSEKELRK